MDMENQLGGDKGLMEIEEDVSVDKKMYAWLKRDREIQHLFVFID